MKPMSNIMPIAKCLCLLNIIRSMGIMFIAMIKKYRPDVISASVSKANLAQKISITTNEKMAMLRYTVLRMLFVIVFWVKNFA